MPPLLSNIQSRLSGVVHEEWGARRVRDREGVLGRRSLLTCWWTVRTQVVQLLVQAIAVGEVSSVSEVEGMREDLTHFRQALRRDSRSHTRALSHYTVVFRRRAEVEMTKPVS